MLKARILVVDDNPLNLKLAAEVLESDGYHVNRAPSAEAALERIREQIPDLILMDIQLPGMDGLALTRALKSDSATQAIPIIALTAFAMKGDEQRARDSGCEGYLTKPIDTRTFSARIAEFLKPGSRRASIKALVIEDFPPDRKLARILLSWAGHEVAEAETGEQALAAARENHPDVILLDLKLPGINGFEVIRQLRQERATRNIPIVTVTAYPDRWTEREARKAGCAAYFAKPVDASVLLKQVRELASRGRPSEQLRSSADPLTL
jgi:two-component system, cell cycle response regulator